MIIAHSICILRDWWGYHRLRLRPARVLALSLLFIAGCQTLESNRPTAGSDHSLGGKHLTSPEAKERAAIQLERALFNQLVASQMARSSLEDDPATLLELLESSVDAKALSRSQSELWRYLKFVKQTPDWLTVSASHEQVAQLSWLEARIEELKTQLSAWSPMARNASQHVKLNLAWDAVYAQFQDNPFGFTYLSLPDLSIKPSLLPNAALYFYQDIDHSIRISQRAIEAIPAEEMAAIGMIYGLPGAHYLTSRVSGAAHFPSYTEANQSALALSMLDIMNRLRPYEEEHLLMPRLAFSQSQLSKLHAALALSEATTSETRIRAQFAQLSGLDEPRLSLEWDDILRSRSSLVKTARSYCWLWKHRLSPESTSHWLLTDYGQAFSTWAGEADRPTPFLGAFD